MRNRKKLMEKFMGLYKIKKIISENAVELELLALMKIYPVINISRIAMYQKQVEKQKKILSSLVKIKGEKEYKIEKVLNKQDVRVKLVRQKGYTIKEDTQKRLDNLRNTIKLSEEFKKEIREEKIR